MGGCVNLANDKEVYVNIWFDRAALTTSLEPYLVSDAISGTSLSVSEVEAVIQNL
jgi:hypothetical protein